MLGVILIHRHMHSLTVTHESRNLKQARLNTVRMLTCYAQSALATPSLRKIIS